MLQKLHSIMFKTLNSNKVFFAQLSIKNQRKYQGRSM